MPTYDCVVSTPVKSSFRAQQLSGMFDVPIPAESSERFEVELPAIDEEWSVGLIVGPSGSGKSTVAREAYGDHFYSSREWPREDAVIDSFGEHSVRDISATLSSVGFSSPPAWLRPYCCLSNGQQFRCQLADALLNGGELVVFDEFTSVVDRTVAKIGSCAVAKTARRRKTKFIGVSCHYDIREWLEPDWVLDMVNCKLTRRRLRRPEIRIEIRTTSPRQWPMFARHHYLNAKQIKGVRCYLATVEGAPACFVAVRTVFGYSGYRNVSRIVVMPDFQGVGIGMAVLNAVAELTLDGASRVGIVTGHPAMMRGLQSSDRWRCIWFKKTGGALSKSDRIRGSRSFNRAVASFRYVPQRETAGDKDGIDAANVGENPAVRAETEGVVNVIDGDDIDQMGNGDDRSKLKTTRRRKAQAAKK